MDLHPGEQIVFEGHPSWRGILGFYIKGTLVAIAIGAILLVAISTAIGIAACAAVFLIAVLAGFVKRMATD